ncbi:MAG: hypothetical protein WCT03_24005 [Candidatus Obscuribacterales bacterium]
MKPDVPRERSGQADNNAAQRLSHEAFDGPGRGMNRANHNFDKPMVPNLGQQHMTEQAVRTPMARAMGAAAIAQPAADKLLVPRALTAAVEPHIGKTPDVPKPVVPPVEPHVPVKPPEVPVKPPEVVVPVKPPEVVVPVKPPEVPRPVVPPVEPHVPVKPPEVVVPPKPPEIVPPPRVVPPTEPHPPVRPPEVPPVVRTVSRYSPPAEPTQPARLPERQVPADRTVKEIPAVVKTEKAVTAGLPPVVKITEGEQKKIVPAVVRKPDGDGHVHTTKKLVEKHGGDKDKPHVVPKPIGDKDKPHVAPKPREHKPEHNSERKPVEHKPLVHKPRPHVEAPPKPRIAVAKPEQKGHASLVGEGKIKQLPKEIGTPAVAAIADIQPIAAVEVTPPVVAVETVTEKIQAPAVEITTVPPQSTGSNVWGEATVSYSPGSKTTVGTATVGKFFDQQNYGYVQGTADLTHGKLGNVSAMYGHSLLSPYDESGKVRRGNVNVEAGVVLNTGASLEGSKLPIFGGTAARVGVNGYYQLDKEGKTTLYGSADYASNPKQADAQVGVSHKLTSDVTVTGGYQVSKVEGYQTGKYATTSLTMKLNENTDLYAGAAIATKSDRRDDKYYAGVRFKF